MCPLNDNCSCHEDDRATEEAMADDPLTAALTAIKGRAAAAADFPLAEIAQFLGPGTRSVGGWIAASAMDVPRLVAAVEEALAKAGKMAAEATRFDGIAASAAPSGIKIGALSASQAYDRCAREFREAITRALTGEKE